MPRAHYKDALLALLSPAERRVFEKLSTPQKIQTYLDTLPVNFEPEGDTQMSPRLVLRKKRAHCFEGALVAATSLAYHGREPLLMDLQTTARDHDHVLALFTENGRWGAISKTNHTMLRWRDPVYRDVRELAMSYFHEYYLDDGVKTMRAYSAPFSLYRYRPERWVIAEKDLDWLAVALDESKHVPVVPKTLITRLRRVSLLERKAGKLEEQKRPRR